MRRTAPLLGCLLALVCAVGGCRNTATPKWGRSATLCPPRERVKSSLVCAALDPQTVLPAAGALVFGLTGADADVADWARRETPIFGSNSRADSASDALLATSALLTLGTGLAAPSGCRPGEVLGNKAKGFAVEAGAVAAAGGLAVLLKETTGRTRPDASDDRSFPSAHTTFAAACAALTRRNSEALRTTTTGRTACKATATGLALLTAWARVEAGRHYPSDVLAGYALGNATSLFVHDTWLGRTGWRMGAGWHGDPGTFTVSLARDL